MGSRDLGAKVAVARLDGETLFAWRTGMTGIRIARAAAGGDPTTDEVFLSDTARPTADAPLVAWSGERFLVGWLEETTPGASSLRVRRYHADFQPEGEVVPIVDGEVTGSAVLAYDDEKFVALWASGDGQNLLRHATIDPDSADARKRIVGAGAGPFEELAAESYADGILISWRGGRVVIEGNGDVRGRPSEVGVRQNDARPPTWTQNEAPALPDDVRGFGRGMADGDRLLVPYLEGDGVFYAAFDASGQKVGGPWRIADADPGPTPVQAGIGPVGGDLGVFYYDDGGTRVKLAVFARCP
jgi:hypothetical protein